MGERSSLAAESPSPSWSSTEIGSRSPTPIPSPTRISTPIPTPARTRPEPWSWHRFDTPYVARHTPTPPIPLLEFRSTIPSEPSHVSVLRDEDSYEHRPVPQRVSPIPTGWGPNYLSDRRDAEVRVRSLRQRRLASTFGWGPTYTGIADEADYPFLPQESLAVEMRDQTERPMRRERPDSPLPIRRQTRRQTTRDDAFRAPFPTVPREEVREFPFGQERYLPPPRRDPIPSLSYDSALLGPSYDHRPSLTDNARRPDSPRPSLPYMPRNHIDTPAVWPDNRSPRHTAEPFGSGRYSPPPVAGPSDNPPRQYHPDESYVRPLNTSAARLRAVLARNTEPRPIPQRSTYPPPPPEPLSRPQPRAPSTLVYYDLEGNSHHFAFPPIPDYDIPEHIYERLHFTRIPSPNHAGPSDYQTRSDPQMRSTPDITMAPPAVPLNYLEFKNVATNTLIDSTSPYSLRRLREDASPTLSGESDSTSVRQSIPPLCLISVPVSLMDGITYPYDPDFVEEHFRCVICHDYMYVPPSFPPSFRIIFDQGQGLPGINALL